MVYPKKLIVNEMAEILNIDEIKSRYDGEWVLIGDPVADESLTVVRGSVLWHSKDRDEVYPVPQNART